MELLLKINGFISQFVTNPKTWQRVLVFGILMFFVAFEINEGKPLLKNLELAQTYYVLAFFVLWVFFAGSQDPKDYLRIALSGLYGALFYMVALMNANGGHWIWQTASFIGIAFFSVYSITGMTLDVLLHELKLQKQAKIAALESPKVEE